ncbi:hypothetical protein GIB67_013766 [Kingdonia uniflora]|uniref:tRNA pseudouridine synthase n=1 Tax=Kingdonia uniflora TaxID=39325 RepID=A0A7J7MNH9_9MAGN|nr:hypothetical protein GIB67_013766 [Kingdonia uniflora]
MEGNRIQEKERVYYNHTDSCNYVRFNIRECFEFMYAKPWLHVVHFYFTLAKARLTLSDLFFPITTRPDTQNQDETPGYVDVPSKGRGGRWARVTYKIILSYHGASFDGWQKQPGLNTIQSLVEKSVGIFVNEQKAQSLKQKSLPQEGCVVVAGRTDKGVTTLNQVCSFYTWRKDVKTKDVENAMLRVVSAYEMSCTDDAGKEKGRRLIDANMDESEKGNKPTSFSIDMVNQLLLQLEGKSLSYKVFVRDTKASRSTGPPTECFLYHARATQSRIPSKEEVNGERKKGPKNMCIELVDNRFLRKMVQVPVATTIREAVAGAEDDALLKLMEATCRRVTAPPAPPDGLCLVDVGYAEFNQENCLIK